MSKVSKMVNLVSPQLEGKKKGKKQNIRCPKFNDLNPNLISDQYSN